MEVRELPVEAGLLLGVPAAGTGVKVAAPGSGAVGPLRSPGLHLSSIIRDIMQTVYPERFTDNRAVPVEKFGLGLAWEDLIGRFLAERLNWAPVGAVERIGELHEDGVHMTPDFFDYSRWVPVETKATWASARREPLDPMFWHWWVQLKGYARATGSEGGVLVALFVNGDYKRSREPCVRIWEAKFTGLELEENWGMLINHAKSRGWL